MTTQETLTLLTLIATVLIGVIGFAFTIYQIKKSSKIKQAEFVNKLLENIRLNERTLNAFYIIDYNNNWYNADFHNSGNLEKSIDALFSQIDYVCYLHRKGLLSDTDLSIFQYALTRICSNYQCQSYLWNLYHWSTFNDTECSFDNLVNYLKTQLGTYALKKFEHTSAEESGYIKVLSF